MLWERRARRAAVLEDARNLARSGRYADWAAVQAVAEAVNAFQAAESWFRDPAFPAQLNQLCDLARKGHPGPRGWKGARLQRPDRLP